MLTHWYERIEPQAITYNVYTKKMNIFSFLVQLFSIIGGVYKLLELCKVYIFKLTKTEIMFHAKDSDYEETGLEMGAIVKEE